MSQEYSFRGQRSNERVIVVAQQHAWVLMPVFLVLLVILALIGASFWFAGASKLSSIVLAVGVILGLLYGIYQWYLWNASNYIVTNQRVIKVEQVSIFKRQISEAELDRIQGISSEVDGPIHTLLNFGTVKIQMTASTNKIDLDLVDVADPYDIQQQIVRIQRGNRPTEA